MSYAIYTSIIGKKDSLIQQPHIYDFDYFILSDIKYESLGYTSIQNPREFSDPRMEAKKYKLFPYKYLPSNYDISLWLDGHIQILKSPAELISKYIDSEGYDIVTFNHPKSNRKIYQEIAACIKQKGKRGIVSNLERQRLSYQKDEILNYSVSMCGIIFRKHSQQCQSLMDNWWSEIQQYSIRDQISFPKVVSNSSCKWKCLPFQTFTTYFKQLKHRKN